MNTPSYHVIPSAASPESAITLCAFGVIQNDNGRESLMAMASQAELARDIAFKLKVADQFIQWTKDNPGLSLADAKRNQDFANQARTTLNQLLNELPTV